MNKTKKLVNFVVGGENGRLQRFPELKEMVDCLKSGVWAVRDAGLLKKIPEGTLNGRGSCVCPVFIDLNFQGSLTFNTLMQAVKFSKVAVGVPVEARGNSYILKIKRKKVFLFWSGYEFSLSYLTQEISFCPNSSIKAPSL